MAGRVRKLIVVAGMAALFVVPQFAFAGFIDVNIAIQDNFKFDPAKPHSENLGAHFNWHHDASLTPHTVTQDDKLFNSGPATNGTIDFTRIPSAGTYHYYCKVHVDLGMKGVIKVRPVIDQDPVGDLAFTVRWAGDGTNTGNAFDVRYRVNSGDWRTWRNDTQRDQAVFGLDDRPVHVNANRTYQFEVRSEKAGDPSKHSDWSPPNVNFVPTL